MARRLAAPHVIAIVLAVAVLSASATLLFDPEPFAPGSATLVAIGLVAYTLIAIAGMLLVRAPWARWLGLGAAVVALVTMAVTGFDTPSALVAAGLLLAAVGGLTGPWLAVWLRQRPGMGPEPGAVALPLVAIGATPVAGIAAWAGLEPPVVAAAVLGPVAAWAYTRAWRWGLWVLRVAYPTTAVVAATQTEPGGTILLVAHGIIVGVLAWTPEAARAQHPVGAPLPAPRHPKRKT